jgi:DNA polymerase V
MAEASSSKLTIEDVWGIGSRWSKALKQKKIVTAFDFIQQSPQWVARIGNSVLGKTHQELQGTVCYQLETNPPDKKSIAFTRSFGYAVQDEATLATILSEYASRVGQKLRKHQLEAQSLVVFVKNSPFNKYQSFVQANQTIRFTEPTNYTPHLIKAVLSCLPTLFEEDVAYAKAGVIALGLQPTHFHQTNLFSTRDKEKEASLMGTMDNLQHRYGRYSLQLGACGVQKQWWAKSQKRSSFYTTDWDSLVTVQV